MNQLCFLCLFVANSLLVAHGLIDDFGIRAEVATPELIAEYDYSFTARNIFTGQAVRIPGLPKVI